jgi:hypothetical protein
MQTQSGAWRALSDLVVVIVNDVAQACTPISAPATAESSTEHG